MVVVGQSSSERRQAGARANAHTRGGISALVVAYQLTRGAVATESRGVRRRWFPAAVGLLALLALGAGPMPAGALDTDIFTGNQVPPNVMVIFDNSGSMGNAPYSTWPLVVYTGAYDPPQIYTRCANKNAVSGGSVTAACTCAKTQTSWVIDQSGCAATFVDLLPNFGDDIDDREGRRKKGNRRNWEINQPKYCQLAPFLPCVSQADCPGTGNGCMPQNQLGLAKSAIISTVNNPDNEGVRWGLMVFDPQNLNYATANYGSAAWVTSWHVNNNVFVSPVQDLDPQNKAQLLSSIGGLTAAGGTPTVHRLIDAWKYFNGEVSAPGFSTSPIQHTCQRNYMIMVTDGVPEGEADYVTSPQTACPFTRVQSFVGNPGDLNGDGKEDPASPNWTALTGASFNCGSDYLDDAMKKIRGQFPLGNPENQPLKLYAVSFGINYCEEPAAGDTSPGAGSLLWRAAEKYGGGQCISALTPTELDDALREILNMIRNDAQSFVAPVVPVSQTNRTLSGDRMYIALFAPSENGQNWPGNVKKYALNTATGAVCNASTPLCGIGDLAGAAATDDGTILGTAESFWDAASGGPSGATVTAGGVGGVLLASDLAQRKIYTYTGTSTGNLGGIDLTQPGNGFNKTNTAITNATLGLTGNLAQPDDRDALIDFMYGFDAYDADNDTNTTEKRPWVLGDIIHSIPLIIDYTGAPSLIVVGANDGMLHAFDDTTGAELWAFVPPDVLSKLHQLAPGEAGSHPFFADGAPRLRRLANGAKIIVFGLHGGGRAYYALDVTNRAAPRLLWRINEQTPGFGELGESWSTPGLKKFAVGGTTTEVAVFGGGYDPSFDDPNQTTALPSGMGSAIYMVDLLTGAPLPLVQPANMTYPVAGDPLLFDVNGDGVFDRGYIGDLGGNLWRLNFDSTVERLFQAPAGRRIFTQPDAVLNPGYVAVYFGTGDRANPMRTDIVDRFYAVRDDGTNDLAEAQLVNITNQLVQPDSAEEAALIDQIAGARGWVMTLGGLGEKVLSDPSVYFNLLFTTFTPNTDPCSAGGDARIYALNPLSGAPTLDLAGTGGSNLGGGGTGSGAGGLLTLADRFVLVGSSIPTEMKVTFGPDQSRAFFGVTKGGGIALQPLQLPQFLNSVIPVSWRQEW